MSSLLRTTTGLPSQALRRATVTVACLGLLSGSWFFDEANAAQGSSDQTKRLAERAIAQGSPQRVTLRPGIVDPALRSVIPPIPNGWVTLGTVDRAFEPAGSIAPAPAISQAFFDVPNASVATLGTWHERFLVAGWTREPPNGAFGPIGNPIPQSRTYCRGTQAVTVISTSTARSTAVSVIKLDRPCGRPALPPQVAEIVDAMRPPTLRFPANVFVVKQKRSTGSPVSDTVDFTVQTPTPVGELHDLAAKEMSANGWTKEDTATAPSIIISRWRKDAGGAPVAAILYVSTAPGLDRRTIAITTSSNLVAAELNFTGEVLFPAGPVTTKVP